MSSILIGIALHQQIESYVDSYRDSGGWPDNGADHAVELMQFIEAHLARAVPKTEEERQAYLEFALTQAVHVFYGKPIASENLERDLQSENVNETEAVIIRGFQLALGKEPLRFPENAFKRGEA